jgi:ATP-dependent RNA helicase RhlE
MDSFENLNLTKQLASSVYDLGFEKPTPIQKDSFSVVLSGKDVVGIAQTGTGKTLAYLLPVLQQLKFSDQINPRVLILVPTRELVLQLVEDTEKVSKYINVRILGVYGGKNINVQKQQVSQGTDILIATPGRLFDLAVSGVLQLKNISKLIIDEVDIMLDLGFRYQLTNIFELLSDRRQNIMFSATMTDEVAGLINEYFVNPVKISIAVSGTRLDNIKQSCYSVQNFYTKVNLLLHLLNSTDEFKKVLVFVSGKKIADGVFELVEEAIGSQTGIVHSNKSQNHRFRTVQQFAKEELRVVITTDVMARGLDIDGISHVINFDTPGFPENYMHRIGRTGRAEHSGNSILFFTEKEAELKNSIEKLMKYTIPQIDFPDEVEISSELISSERPRVVEVTNTKLKRITEERAFHEKKEKNKKTNQGGSYLRKMKKYKNPKTRGDKNSNNRKKK